MFARMNIIRNFERGMVKVENNIEHIQQTIKQLEGPVLTIYLNTNPTNENWKIRLKNGLKKTEEYIDVSNPEDVQQFADIRKRVDAQIKDDQTRFKNSLICFATKDEIVTYHFQFQVENDFQWDEKPATEQLNKLFEQYPKSGVVLLQRDQITLITSTLGEFVDEVSYELDLESRDWKQYKGLGYEGVRASSANHRDKFDQRVKENQERWFKSIVPIIERFSRTQGWSFTHLAGPAELTQQMHDLLNIKVTGETTRNYSGKSAQDILNKTVLVQEDEEEVNN